MSGSTVVELSVSHYLLARGLDSVGLSERDITLVNTADADMVSAWAATGVPALVTWNPMLGEIKGLSGTSVVFDSSKTPGEILDLTVVKSDVLAAHPEFKALAGAWYEPSRHGRPRNRRGGANTWPPPPARILPAISASWK